MQPNELALKTDPENADREGSFSVVLAESGRVIEVTSDQTVLEALEEAGVLIPNCCRQGVCGTCLTEVLEGELDHRDQYLTEEEKASADCFLPCCSRAKGKTLVLKL